MNTHYLIAGVLSVIVVSILGFNAEAIEYNIISPNTIVCSQNTFVSSYNSTTGNYTCTSSNINNTNGEPPIIPPSGDSPFTEDEISKLKTMIDKIQIDDTHFYVDSRFNGVGENLRPSGSQFQIYCDKVDNQNCTLWMTSADDKTSALIFSKDIDNEWSKIGAISEGSDNNSMQIITYDDNDEGELRIKFTDDRTEVQNGLRIMTFDSASGSPIEQMRFWDNGRITIGSGAERCNVTIEDGFMMCE